MNMGASGGPHNNIGSSFMVSLILLLIFVPHHRVASLINWSEPGSWNSFARPYPFTITLKLTSHMVFSSFSLCVGWKNSEKWPPLKQTSRLALNLQKDPLKETTWCVSNGSAINKFGWFYPLYYGTGPCEDVTPNFGSKNRNHCKREIYPNYAVGALGTNHKFEYFPYAPIGNKWWFIVYPGGKPS